MRKFLIHNSRHLIFLLTCFLLSSQMALAAEDLLPPTIAVYPDVYYPLDEVLYLEGRAMPDSAVQINFQKHGLKPINLNTKSDLNGEWVLIEKVPLEAGDWEIRTRIVKSTGEASMWSNPRALKAIITGVVIGGVTVKFAFLLFLLLIVLVVSAIFVYYFFHKMKQAIHDKEKGAVKAVVERNFMELRKDIMDELEHLDRRVENDERFSKEEEEHRMKLLRELREAEDEIEDKLKNL